MRFCLILLILAIINCNNVFCQAEKMDSIFSDWNSLERPGGAVAVIKDGEVLYKKSFGASDTQGKTPNLLSTPFDLASIAKQFTATCVALMEEQGKLSKEDNIKKYFPEFSFTEIITVKNLLDHTSGIREAYVLTVLSGKVNLKGQVPGRYQTKEYLLEVLSKENDLNFKTGEEMVYTNINYILLGSIVEKVSGMSLREFADSAIFKPLKMHHTFFNDEESNFKTKGYFYNGRTFKRRTAKGGIVGDHNLISTIDDLILWSSNFYDNKLGKRDPNFFDTLYRSSKLNNGEDTGYGYGAFVSGYKGFNRIYHGGDNGIHTSIIIRIPEKQLVVICLANSSRYSDTESKAYAAIDMLIGTSSQKPNASGHFNYIDIGDKQLSSKAGLYYSISKNGLAQLRKVTFDNGSLFISDNYNIRGLKLSAVNENYFVAMNPLGEYLHINFSVDTTFKATLHERYSDRVDLHFSWLKSTEIQARDFTGIYINKSTGAKIKVKSKKQNIKARKGIIKIPLIALKGDMFYATQNDALFLFDRNVSEQVVSLRINAQDFRNFKLNKVK